ncbi:MAG: hypothetical protein HC936_03770 [Leptolyngbyaceae cyanobacterium SU_3_3]|nr:hypothetical protein [Leptolyngbyaceae cyanobacterium SU_3_3]
MKAVQLFALESHSGPYDKWPLRTRLLIDGKLSPILIPGYILLCQFKIDDGYLLVTDCDCPYEETTSFILLSNDMKLISYKMLFVLYGSFNFESIAWINSQYAQVTFWKNDIWNLRIRKFDIPYLLPRLILQRHGQTKEDAKT